MEKCLLERCEFAWNGQCCFVCPKGLNKKIERNNAADRIEAFVKTLKKIKRGKRTEKEGELPRGICLVGDVYKIYISHKKKQIWLGSTRDIEEALNMRADAEETKQNGTFDDWLKKHRTERDAAKKAKRTAKKKVS